MPGLNSPGSVSTSSIPPEPPGAIPGETDGKADYRVHWRRYRRTLWFAGWLLTRVIVWELVLRMLVGEQFVGAGRTGRLRRWAREFRTLAVNMGGVMIKLGQFISTRMDVLPPAVIEELASLQDKVPSLPFEAIREPLEADLGPLADRFAAFDREPVAAASLGQVHRARLPDGERVVVKIQRPGIGSLVYTDLKALAVVARWLMRLPLIARRADVPALLDEFNAGMWEELDYRQEADNVDTFTRLFADNRGVYIPHAYREHSTRHVLTLEDVSAIKITDYEAIEAAGISRGDVARRLINTYLHMVFVERIFHADPHAGNLFVYPLPDDAPPDDGQHADRQPLEGCPFYLIFVDFGMVGRLTPAIVAGLRESLIALTTHDAHRLVQSYRQLGVLLPGADTARVEAAARAVFDRVWGMNLDELRSMQLTQMTDLGREFSDLLFSLPFQVPQDFIYLVRAVGILIGLCTGIDPRFDPWQEVQPFANILLAENGELPLPVGLTLRDLLNPQAVRALLAGDNLEHLLSAGVDAARRVMQLPALADDVLRRANRGELIVQIAPAPETERQLRRLESSASRLTGAVLIAGLVVGSAVFYSAGSEPLAVGGLALASLIFLRGLLIGNPR
ncbi:MAG: AarF/ABC1/UbiB kinase family protein [Anaerolineae bacterium]|nr:AarF/ABC1/UbiB kinase family protein [Anaerolineae bacterium]